MSACTVRPSPIPHTPAAITADWLTERLHAQGLLKRGSVAAVTVEPNPLWNVAQTARLFLTYSEDVDGEAPARLFAKIRSQADPYAHLFPGEYAFYSRKLSPDLPLTRCFDAQHDAVSGATCLLLADLSASHAATSWPLPPGKAQSILAVRALARIHAHWWTQEETIAGIARETLQERENVMTSAVADLLPGFFDAMGERLSSERRDLVVAVCAALPDMRRRRLGVTQPLTLLHGDSHWWNFLYPRNPRAHGCVLLDWEDWRPDFSAGDLAQLIALHSDPDWRRHCERGLLGAYLDALLDAGVTGYGAEDLDADYRLGHLGNLAIPVFQQNMGHATWRTHLERWFATFDDLDCRALF